MHDFLNDVKDKALPLYAWDNVMVSSYPMLYLTTSSYYIKIYEKCPDYVLIGVISIPDDRLLFSCSYLATVENVISVIELILNETKTETVPSTEC